VDAPGRSRLPYPLQLARDDVPAEEIQTIAQVGFDLAALNGLKPEGQPFSAIAQIVGKMP
jgi:hypothetical protein